MLYGVMVVACVGRLRVVGPSERLKIVLHMNTNVTFKNLGGVCGGVLKWPFTSPGGDRKTLSPVLFLNFQI